MIDRDFLKLYSSHIVKFSEYLTVFCRFDEENCIVDLFRLVIIIYVRIGTCTLSFLS